MALDRPSIVKAVKDRVYNSGLGQKPSIRQGTGTATVTGDTVGFSLSVGEGVKCKPGHILSSWGTTDTSDAYSFYVLSIATDALTCVNGYDGTAIANSASVPALLEHQAPVTEYTIQRAIDDIVSSYLYPEVFDIAQDTFTPDFNTLQSDADPLDLKIIRGWQFIGPTLYQVPIKLVDDISTSAFASGKMIAYDVRVANTVYYSAVRKVTISTSTDAALEGLIAKGAAALCVEGVEEAHEDKEGGSESRPLWASFYNAKRQFSDSIAKQSVTQFKVDRG